MPTDKEKLYAIGIEILKITNVMPKSGKLYGFNVRDLLWGQLQRITDEQAKTAISKLSEMVK